MFKKLTLYNLLIAYWFADLIYTPFFILPTSPHFLDQNQFPILTRLFIAWVFFISFSQKEPDLKIKKSCIKWWKRFWLDISVVIFTLLLTLLSLLLITLIWLWTGVLNQEFVDNYELIYSHGVAAVILALLFKQRQNRINKIIRVFQESEEKNHEDLSNNFNEFSK